jgi:hypothetical protein
MERGMLAGRMLVGRLAQPDLPPRRATVPSELIVRESSDRALPPAGTGGITGPAVPVSTS